MEHAIIAEEATRASIIVVGFGAIALVLVLLIKEMAARIIANWLYHRMFDARRKKDRKRWCESCQEVCEPCEFCQRIEKGLVL